MTSLKLLLTLGVAMAVSSVTFAETTTANVMLKDNATQTVDAGKQAVTSVKNVAKESTKSAATEKMKEVKAGAGKDQPSTTKEKARKTAKVNINTSDAKMLQTLNGIGETKAQAIIDYRTRNGKIKDLKELANVPGIGEATLEKLKGAISF